MDAKELNILWQSYQLRVTDEIAKSPEVLFCNGSVIGTLGNFSASTGKAKSKKTFNVSAILAAALTNGEVLRYIAEFPMTSVQSCISIPSRAHTTASESCDVRFSSPGYHLTAIRKI